jgi:pseudaminic acid synthase
MVDSLEIAGRRIAADAPPYIIAELSGNHNGDINRAFSIMEAAKAAGADAVKLQTYTADTITIDHDGPGFTIEGGLWDGRTLYELYNEAHTPWDWHPDLFAKGRELGITVFSSPFDATAVEFLESLDAPAYKVASFEIIDLPLIERIAAAGKPMIISTGMANLEEIHDAVETARAGGCADLVLLHCVSSYPAPAADSNLLTIRDLSKRFETLAGLSDHTLGLAVPIAAVSLGAIVIEKHVTLDRAAGGPDAAFSLEIDELAELVNGARTAWEARGSARYDRQPSESGNVVFRRSLYVVADVAAGETLTPDNIRSIRPGHGLAPNLLPLVLGCQARRNLKRGDPLDTSMVEGLNE